jgi:teichuronic acid exporter
VNHVSVGVVLKQMTKATIAEHSQAVVESSSAGQVFSRGIWWTGLSTFGSRAISVLGALLLAAVLSPKDFGYLAIVNIVIALAQSVFGAAFMPALVHFKGDVEKVASTAFWIAAGVSCLVYCGLWLAAPALESYYGVQQLCVLLRVSALSIVANSVAAVPLGLLQRRRQFKNLLMVGIVSQTAGTGLSIALALWGVGVWALVLGLVANAFVTASLALRYSRLLPRFRFHLREARPLMGFSLWVVVGGIQTWLFLSGDNAIAARSFNAVSLGVYALGFNLANTLPGIVSSVVSMVAYPSLCWVQRVSPAGLSATFLDVQTVTATIVLPVACLASALAVPVTALLFRGKWVELGFAIQWLSILPGACAIWSLNSDGYRAIGRPDLSPRISAASLGLLLPCLAVAARYGLRAFIVTRCVAALPLCLFNMVVAGRVLRVPLRAQLSHLLPTIIASGALWCTTTGLLHLYRPAPPMLLVCYLAACASAGLCVYLLVVRFAATSVWQCVQDAIRSFRSVDSA